MLIEHATRQQVADRIVLDMAPARVLSANPYTLIFGEDSPGNAFLYGTRFNPVPQARAIFTLYESPRGVNVSLSTQMVGNPGTGFESITDVTDLTRDELIRKLEQLKQEIDKPNQP